MTLPKLTLRQFNGKMTQWTTFWETYESAIHNNKDLSDIHKFNYLNSLLECSAHEAVSGLALSFANYHEAIAILKKCFGNNQQIVSKHMDILLTLEAVTSSHNLLVLRHLYDLIESHIRSLKSLGVESSSYGSMLSSILLNKFPSDLRLVISRKLPARKRVKLKPNQPPQCRTSSIYHNCSSIKCQSIVSYLLLLSATTFIEQLYKYDPDRSHEANSEEEWLLFRLFEEGSFKLRLSFPPPPQVPQV